MVTVRSAMIFLFWFLIQYCLAVTCHPPRGGVLPLTLHCHELTRRLLDASRTAHGMALKDWGRALDNTPTAVHLPKIYWIAGAGPRTCAVVVDVDNHTPDYIERFNLGEVGHAAEHVENACLFRKGEVGTQRIGAAKRIEVELERVNVDALSRIEMKIIDVDRKHGGYLMSSELGVSDLRANQTGVNNS